MLASELKYKIDLYSNVLTIDSSGTGAAQYNLTLFKTIWAAILNPIGNRVEINSEDFSTKQKDFKVRWDSTINESFQIKYKNEFYRILSILEIGLKDFLLIKVELIK